MLGWDRQTPLYWLMECDVIAGSGSYVVNGYPDAQVTALRNTLQKAAAEGINWREIYTSIYTSWRSRRPHFPDPDTMAILLEQKP